jgi:hypothetical protein
MVDSTAKDSLAVEWNSLKVEWIRWLCALFSVSLESGFGWLDCKCTSEILKFIQNLLKSKLCLLFFVVWVVLAVWWVWWFLGLVAICF